MLNCEFSGHLAHIVGKSAIYSVLLAIVCGIFISLVYYMQTVYAETQLINSYILFAIAGFVVAFGFQPVEGIQQHPVVPRVQTYCRLIQNVADPP